MSNHIDPRDPESEQALRDLFARAAPRPAPPPEDEAEIRDAIYAEWDAVTGRRVLLRRAGAAIAAAAVVASVLLLVIDTGTGPMPVVATIERVEGNVQIEGVSGQLRVGSSVLQDAQIATRSGRIALRLVEGGSLRLTAQTEMNLAANSEVELLAGAVYFDSEQAFAASRLTVRTAFGTLQDIGTQFVARLDSDRIEIGVRDGRVALVRGAENVAAAAGERITVPRGAGSVRREMIASFGDEWAWAERLAPPFDIDGRRAVDFLEWVAAQTGRTLVFADAASERIASDAVLHGSIDLEPLPKLAAALTLTDLDYTLDGDRILIRTKTPTE